MPDDIKIMQNTLELCKTIQECNVVINQDDVIHNFLQSDFASNAGLTEEQKQAKFDNLETMHTDIHTYYKSVQDYYSKKLTY